MENTKPTPEQMKQQRSAYVKEQTENNKILKLEADKWKYMFESVYYRTNLDALMAQEPSIIPEPEPQTIPENPPTQE